MPAKLIVGLGNPGSRYALTRHNIGRRVIESLATDCAVCFSKHRRLKASVAICFFEDSEVILAFPEMFMNLCGEAVARLVRHYRIDPAKNLLVILDDLALPPGRLRLRQKGSSGGHNGLKSLEQHLGTRNFPRLRVGIGHPSQAGSPGTGRADVCGYVLSMFPDWEAPQMEAVLAERALTACRLWIRGPMGEAMSIVNRFSEKS